ncbi:MAG: ABC transporter substrate-binding protein, partial [Chitinivibrionales bacterium]|nr:ABC transporter substrate-binding protein [Chitinivibrionales bacterium]
HDDHGHDSHHEDDANHDGHHHHTGKDPHIWLSPVLMKQQAETMADALALTDPDGAAVYKRNLETVLAELDSLDSHLDSVLAPYRGTELFVFHPAFGYFADQYGLHQKAVEIGGKEPSARGLARLIEEAREHKPRVIFVQPQFSQRSAQAVAEQVGCAVVPINPLPQDYFGEMRAMGAAVRDGLAER